MKKTIKFICSALAVCMFFCLFSGCAKNNRGGEETSALEKFTSDYRVELLNFENWYPDFSLIRVLRSFGKVTRNEDPKFVKSGKYSAKLQTTGAFNNYLDPSLYFPTKSTYYDFNYSDFTYTDRVDFWIYNDCESEKTLRVGLVSDIVNYENVRKLPAAEYELNAKSWNFVSYRVDFNAMSITQKIDAEQIMKIQGIYFEFQHAESADLSAAPVYYLDDMNIYYKKQANKLKDASEIVQFDKKENGAEIIYELCDFEKIYQKNIFSYYTANSECIPKMTVVKAENEGVENFQATSGSRVLKVEMKPAGESGGYTELILSDKVVRAFYNEFVFDYSSARPIIPVDEWKDYRLAYDVYCDFDVGEFYVANFFYKSDNSTLSRASSTVAVNKSREWVTWSFGLKEMDDKLSSRYSDTNENIKKAYDEYAAFYDEHGYGERVSDAGQIRMVYPDVTGESKVMYIDNIRLYKVS